MADTKPWAFDESLQPREDEVDFDLAQVQKILGVPIYEMLPNSYPLFLPRTWKSAKTGSLHMDEVESLQIVAGSGSRQGKADLEIASVSLKNSTHKE